MSARGNTSVRVSKDVHSKRMAETPAVLKVGQALDEHKKIRECLGAAVIMRWGTLPTQIQRELFDHATSLAESKGQIARFLHNHKDDGDQAPRRVVWGAESAAKHVNQRQRRFG